MIRRSLYLRVVLPIAVVLGVMILSNSVYDASRHIQNRTLHSILSNSSAILMFLSIWLVALLCMGLSEIWCRIIARKKPGDTSIKVFAPINASLLILSFTAVVLMLWNGGHAYYYLYMDVYTKLFL